MYGLHNVQVIALENSLHTKYGADPISATETPLFLCDISLTSFSRTAQMGKVIALNAYTSFFD